MKPEKAIRYFQRLADTARTRAALARRKGDEAEARQWDEKAIVYEQRKAEVK